MNFQDYISRYMSGKMSMEEAADFLNWLSSQKGEQDLDLWIRQNWSKKGNADYPEWNPEQLSERIMSDIGFRKPLSSKRANRISFLKIAASFLILLSAGCLVWWMSVVYKSEPVEKQLAVLTRTASPGQKITFALPDGSKVKLNSGSRIVFPERFIDSVRQVELYGEAFFEVKSDQKHPFIVKAGGITAKVLGTSFNIKHTRNGNDVSVSLMTGKLLVNQNNQQLYLMPGEKAIYNASGENLRKHKWNYQQDLSWIDGILYFEDNSFSEVVEKLESWYGVSFQITGKPLEEKHYTAAFDNESLENVLLNLSFSHLFDYEITEKSITIKFNNE